MKTHWENNAGATQVHFPAVHPTIPTESVKFVFYFKCGAVCQRFFFFLNGTAGPVPPLKCPAVSTEAVQGRTKWVTDAQQLASFLPQLNPLNQWLGVARERERERVWGEKERERWVGNELCQEEVGVGGSDGLAGPHTHMNTTPVQHTHTHARTHTHTHTRTHTLCANIHTLTLHSSVSWMEREIQQANDEPFSSDFFPPFVYNILF